MKNVLLYLSLLLTLGTVAGDLPAVSKTASIESASVSVSVSVSQNDGHVPDSATQDDLDPDLLPALTGGFPQSAHLAEVYSPDFSHTFPGANRSHPIRAPPASLV